MRMVWEGGEGGWRVEYRGGGGGGCSKTHMRGEGLQVVLIHELAHRSLRFLDEMSR